MRIERAIDAFLDWRRLERDATPRSIASYRRILDKLAEDYPELELDQFTKQDLRAFLKRWAARSAATRANVVSVLHSFFGWAVAEDLIEVDPSAPLRRPRKRRADVYRPSLDELGAVRAAALPHELPAILLMEGAGLRRAEVLCVRWADVDLIRGRVRVFRKGANWQPIPLAPDVLEGLRGCFRLLQPELDDHVFTVEVEHWVSQYKRRRKRRNPKLPASDQSLWRMVQRVCKRAGIRELSPHQLRHGFANRFLRESGRDVAALRPLLGHSRIDTTQLYTDEIEPDELAKALAEAFAARDAQASPDLATLEADVAGALQSLRWRRRESNPRKAPLAQTAGATIQRCNSQHARAWPPYADASASAAYRVGVAHRSAPGGHTAVAQPAPGRGRASHPRKHSSKARRLVIDLAEHA
jgi:site-specific recombinase XerD